MRATLFKLFQTLIGISIIVIAPLYPRWDLLCSWPLWVATFAGAWVHLAPPHTRISTLIHENPTDRGSTFFMILAAGGLGIISFIDYAHFHDPRPSFVSFWSMVGILLIALGLLLRQWTIHTLGAYFTARVTLEDEHEMIDVGPYHYLKIRHPAYLGTYLVGLGIPVVLRSYWGVAWYFGVMVPVYLYRIHVEESALHTKLKDKYIAFSKRSRRLIPFIY